MTDLAIAVLLVVVGVALAIPHVLAYIDNSDLAARRAHSVKNHRAATELGMAIGGTQIILSVLLLNAALRAGARRPAGGDA